MTRDDLKTNHVYSAKRPRTIRNLWVFPVYNDRAILWIGETTLQYDAPTVRDANKFPRITIKRFLEWADKDVTTECSDGEWRIVKEKGEGK